MLPNASQAWRRPFDVAVLGSWALLILVGLTRLSLNRHWLTDVIGAWLLAGLVLAAAAERIAQDMRWMPRFDRRS